MDWNGKRVSVEAMHFKRFENGKIAEIWEYGDSAQIETEEE
jgi:predicted ester cyclase